ncbi:hypothetical protein ACWKW6_12225 [Dyadobacter jiangsuensis]
MAEFLNRKFRIWAYTVSHSSLLLRSEQKYNDVDGYDEASGFNIDIEFGTVAYIDIPHVIENLRIKTVASGFPEKLLKFTKHPDLTVFELTSDDEKYYVVADSYLVGRNNWSPSEDRISNIQLEYDEILATSQH